MDTVVKSRTGLALRNPRPLTNAKWLQCSLRGWSWQWLTVSVLCFFFYERVGSAQTLREVGTFGLGSLVTVEVSPDRSVVAMAGSQGIYLRSALSGEVVQHFFEPEHGAIQTIAISPDNQRVAAGTFGGFVQCWNVETGELVSALNVLALSQRQVRSAGGKIVRRFMDFGVIDVEFLSDSRHIAAGDAFQTVVVWNSEENRVRLEKRVTSGVNLLKVSSRDQIYVRLGTRETHFLDGETGESLDVTFNGISSSGLYEFDFSPDGRRLVGVTDFRTVVMVDFEREQAFTKRFEQEGWHHFVFSPDAEQALLASHNELWLMNATNGETTRLSAGPVSHRVSPVFSPDGGSIVYFNDFEHAYVMLNVATGRVTKKFQVAETLVGRFSPSPVLKSVDPETMIVGSATTTIHLWNLKLNESLWSVGDHGGEVKFIAPIPKSGRFVALEGFLFGGGVARVWDTDRAQAIRAFEVESPELGIVSPDGSRFYSPVALPGGDRFNTDSVGAWRLDSGERRSSTVGSHRGRIASLAISPDGDHLVTGGADRSAKVWNVKSLRLVSHYREHSRTVNAISYSPTSDRVISSDLSRQLYLWDAVSGEKLWERKSPNRVSTFEFSDDGKLVAGGGGDRGTYTVWNVETGEEIASHAPTPNEVVAIGFHSGVHRFLTAGINPTTISLFDIGTSSQSVSNVKLPEAPSAVVFLYQASRLVVGNSFGAFKLFEVNPFGPRLKYSWDANSRTVRIEWADPEISGEWVLESTDRVNEGWIAEPNSDLGAGEAFRSGRIPPTGQRFFRARRN